MLLNNLNSHEKVLAAFTQDCLDQFKGVVDILAAMVSWKGARCDLSLLLASVERIKTFFE